MTENFIYLSISPGMPDSRQLKSQLCTATPLTSSPVLEKLSLLLKTVPTLDQLMISSSVLRRSLVQVIKNITYFSLSLPMKLLLLQLCDQFCTLMVYFLFCFPYLIASYLFHILGAPIIFFRRPLYINVYGILF